MKIVSHKNTATLGDFANTWPAIDAYAKVHGPVHITLPAVYQQFVGLKELLEFQDFCHSVDFDDRDDYDVDVQAHLPMDPCPPPTRTYYAGQCLGVVPSLDFTLKIAPMDVEDLSLIHGLIIDRQKTQVIAKDGRFSPYEGWKYMDFTKPLMYNLNLCLKARSDLDPGHRNRKPIIATFTGFPILLNLARIPFDLIWFPDVPGWDALKWHYFEGRGTDCNYIEDLW